jgi:hypothetical protein
MSGGDKKDTDVVPQKFHGDDEPNYDDWTIEELKKRLEEVGVKYPPDATKDDLIRALKTR